MSELRTPAQALDLDNRIATARRVLDLDDPVGFLQSASDREGFNVGLLYAYIRAFVRLARLGNVALVSRELGITRQTTARQIHELENMLGCTLFDRIGSVSTLTDQGALWLNRAQEVYELAMVFPKRGDGCPVDYRSVQLPLRSLRRDPNSPELLRDVVGAWMTGDRTMDCSELTQFSDHWIVYERRNGVWHSRVIGQQTEFARWFGRDATLASDGQSVPEMSGGYDLRDELSFVLDGVYCRAGIHYSKIACKIRRVESGRRIPIRYQRVLMEVEDESNAPVIASVTKALTPDLTDLEAVESCQRFFRQIPEFV